MGMSTIQELIEDMKRERHRLVAQIQTLDAKIGKLKEALAIDAGTVPGKKKMTFLQMAEEVLELNGSKMRTKDIAEAIQKKFDSLVKPNSLGTMLYRSAVERKKTFRKEKEPNNTYSLLKWQ
jgi:hypothetical protein